MLHDGGMLDLYTWHTPNGRKVPILLAELGIPYELHLVDLGKDEQKRPEYLAINPNGKIPALVDDAGPGGERVVLFESGAILEYLATRAGKLLPSDPQGRATVMSWLFWQVGGPGPNFGRLKAFGSGEPGDAKAFGVFDKEARRLTGVLDAQLRGRTWMAGEYSIADIATYPWFAILAEIHAPALEGAAEVRAWMKRMAERPAVQRGMKLEK